MKPEHWIALGTAMFTSALTAVGLFLGPKLAVKRALQQFRSQKWWELQETTYRELLRDIGVVHHWIMELQSCYVTKEPINVDTSQTKEYFDALRRIRYLRATGSYIVSQTTIDAIGNFVCEIGDDQLPDEYQVDPASKAVNQSIKVIRREAQVTLFR